MITFSGFIIESSLILLIFYTGYLVFFSREGSFRQNRIFLLAGILLGLILPFIRIPSPVNYEPYTLIKLKTVEVLGNGGVSHSGDPLVSFKNFVIAIYIIGVLYLIFRMLYQVWRLTGFRNNSQIVHEWYGKLVYTGKRHPVFTFGRNIYIDAETEKSGNLEMVLKHEKVHVVQWHVIDLFLLEVLAIVQWFNPIVWMYNKIVRQNHEFLADRGVIRNGIATEEYQQVLLNSFSVFRFGLANSFNHSLTFKRLIMMKKVYSGKYAALKLIFILPVMAFSIYFVSCKNNDDLQKTDQSAELKVIKGQEVDSGTTLLPPPPPPPPPVTGDDKNLKAYQESAIDVKPKFPGGEKALIDYVAHNVKYPEQARKNGIQGTVYIKFIVRKDGLCEVDEIIEPKNGTNDPMLVNEAIRVVNSLPKWKPGEIKGKPVDVYFVIPIKFKLQ